MKLIFRYMKIYLKTVIIAVTIKFIGTFSEFLIPYVLEHMLDEIVPRQELRLIMIWGAVMIFIALWVRTLNVTANRMAVKIARNCIYDIRNDMFTKTMEISGNQVDKYGLPSLISRMTSDSYNIQNFIRSIQTMGIRAPILLLGGITATIIMDPGLSVILLVLVPVLIVSIVFISRKGIPLYDKVQRSLDAVVRIMRENITGIRVIKALSKEKHQTDRFKGANDALFEIDTKASVVMSLPGPMITLFLNIGLTGVVILGAYRVNAGVTKPGVILAFLTYFNMILMGVGGLNRIFMMISKANASAKRIGMVLEEGEPFEIVYADNGENKEYIEFEHVNFGYLKEQKGADELELEDICFSMKKGSTLGIIGATGSGKTTIVNLIMRFYDVNSGNIYVDGKNVKSYEPRELRKKFGVVFQNDVIFADTLYENIEFGREVGEQGIVEACENAQAWNFISKYDEKLEYKADIHGANLSGGQKQRLLIARALAANPEILILDDSSSALDYKTDAVLRHVINSKYSNTTTIMIAQRISSIMNMDNILVIDDGRIIDQGKHQELMERCQLYKEIYEIQMT